jgi:hypothetical protein
MLAHFSIWDLFLRQRQAEFHFQRSLPWAGTDALQATDAIGAGDFVRGMHRQAHGAGGGADFTYFACFGLALKVNRGVKLNSTSL